MFSKILAVALFLASILILVSLFFIQLELPLILGMIFASFMLALFGVVTFRHGFKNAVRATHKGQPDYLK